jgi:protein SDA1
VYPSLLQGKDRGLVGTGLHRAGEKPLRYGEVKAATGVEGADLLAAYEASKKAAKATGSMKDCEEEGDSDEDGEESASSWIEVEDDDNSDIEIEDDEDVSEDEAPELVQVVEGDAENDKSGKASEELQDLSKLSETERAKLQQQVSSTRIFTSAEFAKMQKLVERQQQARRDPRMAAKLKRAIAKGDEFADISDDDSVDSDDEEIHISGAVTPTDIMADAKKKRMSKAEKLQKILEGRQKWEAKVCQ